MVPISKSQYSLILKLHCTRTHRITTSSIRGTKQN